MSLYPLKFIPIFKEKLWGGQKIKSVLGKDFGDLENCGETWELSGVDGNISKVASGELQGKEIKALIHQYRGELVGEQVYERFRDEFPLLIKFIDAAQDLSIQVHPDDMLAKKRHNGFGKSEMWYVLQADSGSTLISGFSRKTSRDEFLSHFDSGKVAELLNVETARTGDVFYLPAGRVHTIGKGILLAEIHQTSDITYRIYDFDRVDKDGNKRELHVDQALEAIDFDYYGEYKTNYPKEVNKSNRVVKTPFFTTNKFSLDKKINVDHTDLDCFKVYIGVGGNGFVAGEPIRFGEVILIPASMKEYAIEPAGTLELLETYIEL